MFSPDGSLSRILSTVFDVLMIGILWLVTSLPIITLVPATISAYHTMAKVVRYKSGYIREEFFAEFKANFKRTLPLMIVNTVLTALFVVELVYLWSLDAKKYGPMFMIVLGIAFLYTCVIMYIPAFLSRFDEKVWDVIKLSAYVAFRYLPVTVLMIIVLIAACLAVWIAPWACVVLPGVYIFLITFPMEKILKVFIEDDEDAWWEDNSDTNTKE
ncbi:MAG: DUF624 domain-containing protein [Lachnospiraceae bacterium]|nr:DUF624 domain-containing protein [Lachnospiraceae bacterium]